MNFYNLALLVMKHRRARRYARWHRKALRDITRLERKLYNQTAR